jgi:hypothetical protein
MLDLTGKAAGVALEVALKGTELTLNAILAPLRKLFEMRANPAPAERGADTLEHGEQSIKSLNMHNRPLETVEVPCEDVRAFKRELNRHGVDFAVMKDKGTGICSAYFKGQDIQRVTSALEKTVHKIAREQTAEEPKPAMESVIASAQAKADAIGVDLPTRESTDKKAPAI